MESVENDNKNVKIDPQVIEKYKQCLKNTVSKQWIDYQGQIFLTFIAYTDLAKREVEIYLEKKEEPLLIKQFIDQQYSPQQMVLNFTKQSSALNWYEIIDKQFILYQKYVKTDFLTYCCETHECVANCVIECSVCEKTYSCTKCVLCDCFKLSCNIFCKKCGAKQNRNNQKCLNCGLTLYDRLCEICGPYFVMNGEPVVHCNKCNSCHNITHQYCKICGRCSEKETFIETHRHNPRSVVCCICNEIRHIEAMKYKTLKKCECSCCFTCMTLCDQICKHGNHFGWLSEGLTWGGL